MKKNCFIYTLLMMILIVNNALGADFYPEMGMDPFYSSLNPMYINEDETPTSQDSILNIIKKKKQERAEKRKNKELDLNFNKETTETVDFVPAKNNIINEEINNSIKDVADDNFVTTPKKKLTRKQLEKELISEEKEKQKELEHLQNENKKSLKERLFAFKTKKKNKVKNNQTENIQFDADYMEYYPDRYEVEAIGNAKVLFKSQNIKLTANKIVFNYDKNTLKAHENVVLTSNYSTTEGDFIKIDLSKPNGWIENPITTSEDVKLKAKEAYIYSDRIEDYDGVAKILKDDLLSFGARSFTSYVDHAGIFQKKVTHLNKNNSGVYKIKANEIIIDSKNDHEIITVKNANLYLKNHKIATIPSVQMVTNKELSNVETNIPEFGSLSMLGMHAGPAVVLNVPGGSTLKLAPIVTYKDDKWGVGGIARFRNQYNMTEVGYGTSKDELIVRGRHKFAPGLLLNYSKNTNQNEWFLGYRMPKYSAQLSYSRSDYIKDLKLNFAQMYTAGAFIDNTKNADFGDTEGRFRWMTQTYKPIYKYKNDEGTIGFNIGLVAQTAASVYTTGDTFGLLRVGPALNTKVGPWNQGLLFYQTGIAGHTPFSFDRYRYGRSNLVLIESLRICKYLSVGYLASLAMNREYREDDLLQENRILLSIGPEYAKFTIGYDSIRRNTMFILSMLVGTENSDIEFKKTVIKNPEKLGQKHNKKQKKKSYKKYLKEVK